MKLSWLRNILIALALVTGAAAHAQVIGSGVDPLQYVFAPDTPGPNAPVTISISGVGNFLGDADVTWSLNGAVAKQGPGVATFSFTTGALGSQSVVKLTVDSASQGVLTRTFVFTPSIINLIWEADTSAPPLYAGHRLYSGGAPLRVVAFPTVVLGGKKVAPQSLSYHWSINGNPQPDASGTGKQVLSYAGDQLQTGEDVELDVYFGSAKVGHAEVVVPASDPALVLYNKDALRGVVWDQALPASIALNASELTLFAQPYFFANNGISAGALAWSWTLNGNPVTGPDTNRGILTLRQSGQGQGSASLSVGAQNQADTQLVQGAQTDISILFGQAKSGLSSFFGL